MTIARTVLALAFVLALIPSPAAAQVDEWRVLHVGLQSGARVDTDGDGTVNSWATCKPRGKSGKTHCRMSDLYRQWQEDMTCFESTIERWTGRQIDVVQEQVFIETSDAIEANPYSFVWSGYADAYAFSEYDVVMVWGGFTQTMSGDGNTWGPLAGTTDYAFISLYGVGECSSWHGGIVPPHEFSHAISIIGMMNGFAVCPIYDYPYAQYGEEDGHTMILTNTFPETTCYSANAGVVSTGIPPEAYAAGSYRDYYG
jgi:hypothetical protein